MAMGEKRFFRVCLWLLVLALVVGALPGRVRAESEWTLKRVFSEGELTDGTYVLLLSGQAPGARAEDGSLPALTPVMEAGRPVPAPEILWNLTMTEDGLLLTDPAGVLLGGVAWSVSCQDTLFRFSAEAEGQSLVLGCSGGAFYITEAGQEGVLTEFSLFCLTEQEILPEPVPESTASDGLYFGMLHTHTDYSDGMGTPAEAYAQAAAEMDFLAITDHSNSLTETEWTAGRAAAAAGTTADFAALWGYEMSWPEGKHLGHIGAYGTEQFLSWQDAPYESAQTGLEAYYAALAAESGAIGQFQHPGDFYGSFRNFAYNEEADSVMTLLEVTAEGAVSYKAYTEALDAGWHVSPTYGGETHMGGLCGTGTGRTVVQMESLTPENLQKALKSRRTYATEDGDLRILYTLDGFAMGDIRTVREVGPTAELDVTLQDPTDEALGTLEVIGPGGAVLHRTEADSNPGRITLSLPADKAYYYLRITQPDGDVAVTAPVWVDQTREAGISEFSCGTDLPIQGKPVALTVTLFNKGSALLQIQSLELLADGEPVEKWEDPFTLEGGTTLKKMLTCTHEGLGETELTLRVTGTLAGEAQSYEQSLTLSFRRGDLITGILVDGTHGNTATDRLTELKRLAAGENIQVTVCGDTITEGDLGDCALLLVNSPAEDFSDEFLAAVAEFVSCGGELLVCADDPARAGELNRLLAAVGSTMYFTEELKESRPREFNDSEALCAGINEKQLFYMRGGCALEPGSGTWLVEGEKTIMAREAVGAGQVLACGSLLAADEAVKAPTSPWEEAYANRTMVQALLGIHQRNVPISTIRQVRDGEVGEVYRIQGYVTANTFSNTLMLQDRTAGIALTPFRQSVGLGKLVEVIGVLEMDGKEPVLSPISVEYPQLAGHRYQPQTLNCRDAQKGASYSGLLVQVTGLCADVTLAGDGTLQQFVLKDATGKKIPVVIESGIVSASTKKNTLHEVVEKEKEIWAIGILQTDEKGKTFLRVRNCDEVVFVPPIPYTGDALAIPAGALLLTLLALGTLLRKKRPGMIP